MSIFRTYVVVSALPVQTDRRKNSESVQRLAPTTRRSAFDSSVRIVEKIDAIYGLDIRGERTFSTHVTVLLRFHLN